MSQTCPKIQRPMCRPSNSIIIPRVPAKNQSRQLCKSSVYLLPIGTNTQSNNSNPHGCSSSIPFNGDLFQFSKIMLECKTFFEKEKRSLFVIEKQSNRNLEKQSCFDKFYTMINNPMFLSNLPENYFNELKLTITTIFNSKTNQTVPSTLIYTDLPVYMRYTYFEEMSIIYNAFLAILTKTNTKNLQSWLTTNFINSFIKKLDNPDISERKIIEGIITQIAKILPFQRSFILNHLFNLLQDHIDRLIPYFCVNSAIQCICNIISFPEIKITENQRSIILYLLNSYFLDRFSWDMDLILKKLYDLYPNYSEKVRTFLIYNWPNKDSHNCYYFLSFYASSLYRSKIIEKDASSILGKRDYLIVVTKFHECILSANASNSLQAINFACNPTVYKVMVKVCSTFYADFLKNLEKVKTTWNPFIKQAIDESSAKIKELNEANNITSRCTQANAIHADKKCKNRKMSWNDIKKMARGKL